MLGVALYDASGNLIFGNTEITILPSAAHTTAQTSANFTNANARGILLFLDVTVASGTGGLTIKVQMVDPVTAKSKVIAQASAAVIATGSLIYGIFPGAAGAGGGVTSGVTGLFSGPLPRTFNVLVSVGDSSSYTYSIGGSLIV